tara:strand:+ start:613 stop:1344 length:732 start_codon:yes stop_codon:yes gene_type:complete
MKFNVVTLFPDLISNFLSEGMLNRSIEKNFISIDIFNPRDFTDNRNNRVDDRPFGGGPGMVIQAEPIIKCLESIKKDRSNTFTLLSSPRGIPLTQSKVIEYSTKEEINIVCGRYGGIDERVISNGIDEIFSIGDYVVNGGELPALVLIESIARMTEGFLGNETSNKEDSFINGLLETPQYTRPEKSNFGNVPKVLLSGDHEKIRKWKLKISLSETFLKRPDLLKGLKLTNEEKEILDKIKREE